MLNCTMGILGIAITPGKMFRESGIGHPISLSPSDDLLNRDNSETTFSCRFLPHSLVECWIHTSYLSLDLFDEPVCHKDAHEERKGKHHTQ